MSLNVINHAVYEMDGDLYVTLTGDWYEGGYLADLAPHRCVVRVTSDRRILGDDYPIELDYNVKEQELTGWGRASFAPTPKSVKRLHAILEYQRTRYVEDRIAAGDGRFLRPARSSNAQRTSLAKE